MLKYGTLVKVKSTGSIDLDGETVRIVGIAAQGLTDVYIVEFLEDATRVFDGVEFSAFVLPETCMEVK